MHASGVCRSFGLCCSWTGRLPSTHSWRLIRRLHRCHALCGLGQPPWCRWPPWRRAPWRFRRPPGVRAALLGASPPTPPAQLAAGLCGVRYGGASDWVLWGHSGGCSRGPVEFVPAAARCGGRPVPSCTLAQPSSARCAGWPHVCAGAIGHVQWRLGASELGGWRFDGRGRREIVVGRDRPREVQATAADGD